MTETEYKVRVGELYGYDNFDIPNLKYYGLDKHIEVECFKHGKIYPKASEFLEGHGCRFCKFIEEMGDDSYLITYRIRKNYRSTKSISFSTGKTGRNIHVIKERIEGLVKEMGEKRSKKISALTKSLLRRLEEGE